MWITFAAAVAMCPRPNITDNGQFCIPGPSYLYNFDDRFSIYSGNRCLGTGLCADGDGYNVEGVHGQFCACSYNEAHPDVLLRQGTQYIKCNGVGAPIQATLRGREFDLGAREGDTAKLVELIERFHPTATDLIELSAGNCPAHSAECLGFYGTTSTEGRPPRLWGICQPRRERGNSTDPFFYPVQGSRKTEMEGNTPCNCHGRKPLWKSFRQKAFTEDTEAIYDRVTHEERPDGPCETVRVGWGWDQPVTDSIDPTILTIPPGDQDESKIVYEVEKTGTLKDVPGHNKRVPCGVQEHQPLGSLTLKEYCSARPYDAGSIASVTTYGDGYNVEAAARLYAVRNIQSLDRRLRDLVQLLDEYTYLGITLTRSQPSIIEHMAALHDGSNDIIKYKFALAILNEEMRWGTGDIMERFPPSFHGSEAFPMETFPEFHIGSRNFSLIVDNDGTVSPFRLLLYHFSTSVLDYGVLFNTYDGNSVDFNAEGVRNYAGSFLGQPVEPVPSLKSGFHHYFMGIMPGILGRLTLPGMRSVAPDCHHPVLETLKRRGNAAAGRDGAPTIEYACKIASEIRSNYGLNGLLTDPDKYGLTGIYPFVQEMGRVQGADNIYRTAAKVDLMEQLFQVIRYAMPDVLTQGFWESVRSQTEDVTYPLFSASACPEKHRYVPQKLDCFGGLIYNNVADDLMNSCGVCGGDTPFVCPCHSRGWSPNQFTRDVNDTINRNIVNYFLQRCDEEPNCVGFGYQPAARLNLNVEDWNDRYGNNWLDNHPPLAKLFTETDANARCKPFLARCNCDKFDDPRQKASYESVFYEKIGNKNVNFSTCISGITTIINTTSNYNLYSAHPSWSDKMWRAHDPQTWERLCTTVHEPSAGIVFPESARRFYERSGCDLTSLDSLYKTASDTPLDFYNIAGGCQVPTVLPFSLHPTSRLTRMTRSTLMSEAVATAAWPGLPIERILEYNGWGTGVVTDGAPPNETGKCTAVDEWNIIVTELPQGSATEKQRLHSCKMPYQKAVLYKFIDGSSNDLNYCTFNCDNPSLQCVHMNASSFCLSVEGFERMSSPRHGFGQGRFNMTADEMEWHVQEATAAIDVLANKDYTYYLDANKLLKVDSHTYQSTREIYMRVASLEGATFISDLNQAAHDATVLNQLENNRKAAAESLVAPEIRYCEDRNNRCISVAECYNILRGSFDSLTNEEIILLDYFQDLSQTKVHDSCARHAAVGLDTSLPHDCWDWWYDLMIVATSQDMVAALATGTGDFVPGKYSNSGWSEYTFAMRRFHSRLSAGKHVSELFNNSTFVEMLKSNRTYLKQLFQMSAQEKVEATYFPKANFEEGELIGMGGIVDYESYKTVTNFFRPYLTWISHFMNQNNDNVFGDDKRTTTRDMLLGQNGFSSCRVQNAGPDPFKVFGLNKPSIDDANNIGNFKVIGDGNAHFDASDKATNYAIITRMRALTQLLLRAHVRRGTPIQKLSRSAVMSPILGCTMFTTHFKAPKITEAQKIRQRADCGRSLTESERTRYEKLIETKDALEQQQETLKDFVLQRQATQNALSDVNNQIKSLIDTVTPKAGTVCQPEGGFGQRVPFGDFEAIAKEGYQAQTERDANQKLKIPSGYRGPTHNTFHSVPIGTPAMYLGHPEQYDSKVNTLMFHSNMWRHTFDYATLRAGTTVHATIASSHVPSKLPSPSDTPPEPGKLPPRSDTYWESIVNALHDGPSCYFNRCNDAVSTYHNGDSMQHARLIDVESMAGACYPGQDEADHDTTALYRRRHFIRITAKELTNAIESDDNVYSVDTHGRRRGFLPGGCRYQRREDPPPPPPPPPPPWWEVAVGAVLIVVAVAVPPFGGGLGKAALLGAGVGLIMDFEKHNNDDSVGTLACPNTAWVPGMNPACMPIGNRHPKTRLSRDGTATYLGMPVDTRDVDGSFNLIPSICEEPIPRFTDKVNFPEQTAPVYLSKQELTTTHDSVSPQRSWETHDDGGVLVGVPGTGILLAQHTKVFDDMPQNDIPTFRDGIPDGVTFFDERAMAYPRIWRLASRRVGAERQEFLNPSSEFGFTLKHMQILCAKQETAADCALHRACVINNESTFPIPSTCVARGAIDWQEHCATLTNETCRDTYGCIYNNDDAECVEDENANWVDCNREDIPCSHSSNPVCVEVTILKHEGMSLNAAGTLYAMQGASDVNTTSFACIPITRKLELTTENVKQRFEEGHLWRSNCVYNPRASGCSLPPKSLEDVIDNFNLQEMSNQLKVHYPMSFFSANTPATQLFWGNTEAMSANGLGQDELAHKQWFEQKSDVASEFPFAGTPPDRLLKLNCGPDKTPSDCGLLIDDVTKVNCARKPRGKWPGTCLKPELQLQTPHDIFDLTRDESLQGFLHGPFQKHMTPVRRECPVYEAHSLQIVNAFNTYFPRDTCDWHYEQVPGTNALDDRNSKAMYVHYCAKFANLYAHCDNDYLTNSQRKHICEKEAGPFLYTGLVLDELTIDDICNPVERTCYAIPGKHKFGGFNKLLSAAESRYGDLTGFTFIGTSVDFSILKQVLFGATIENTVNLNAPVPQAEKSDKGACDSKRTCLCCSDLETCCTTCTKDNIRDIEREFNIEDKLISGQRLYERSELIGEQLCNRDVPPVDSLFKNISALGPLWRESPKTYDAERDVYKIVGVDFPNHIRTVTSEVEHNGSVFRARMRNDGPVIIKYPEITFRHVDEDGALYFGTQRLEVRATGFKIYNATFEGRAPGISFEGSTVAGAHVYNVSVPDAELAVAFLGASGTGGVYNPFTNVDGVHVEHTIGKRFMAGFARTTGIATISGCAATLSNACVVPHAYGPCRTWASAYGPPLDHAPNENWKLNASKFFKNQDTDLTVDGYSVYYANDRLHAGTLCLRPVDTHIERVHCDNAPYATETAHFEGSPFFCIKLIDGIARYAPCAGCNVGTGHHTPCDSFDEVAHTVLNRTHCVADGLVVPCTACGLERATCPLRPVGHQILGCTAYPHGSVHAYNTDRTGIFFIEEGGGYGAIYDGDTQTVLVGGYGYAHGPIVQTQRVIIEPAEHTTVFDIRTSAAEVVNVTEYTSVFGAAYERAIFRPVRKARALKILGIFIFASIIALLIVAHVYLTFQRARLYIKEEEETEAFFGNEGDGKSFITKGIPTGALIDLKTRFGVYKGTVLQNDIEYNDTLGLHNKRVPNQEIKHTLYLQCHKKKIKTQAVFNTETLKQIQGDKILSVLHGTGSIHFTEKA